MVAGHLIVLFWVIYIASVVAGGIAGSRRGHTAAGLVWALVLGPVGVAIIFMSPRSRAPR
jgi:hypothetical protein